VFAQDKWTIDRLTLNIGVRYDYFLSAAPETHFGPAPLLPDRDVTFPRTPLLSWHDVTPKLGAAYDLTGDGKTALKVSVNKYVAGQAGGGLANVGPANNVQTTTTRSWTDANRNYAPDCNLLDPASQDLRANGGDFCGPWNNLNFGKYVPGTTQDEDVMRGWGKRGWNWEFATSVQREIIPRVSVDIGYFRRVYGNFIVTDNLLVGPADYDPFSITAPSDPRLPGGGGYVINDLYNLNPAKVGQVQNYQTFASNFGTQIEHWNGMDLTATGRMSNGISFSGGLSTGRSTTDECDVVTKIDSPSARFCRQQEPFLTQVKGLGSYQIPVIDVNVAATFQSIPGPSLQANYTATNAQVQPSLGRPLSGGATNVSVALLEPNTMYGDRVNQVDLRIGKLFRFGRYRSMASIDIFNVANANPVLAESSTYSQWRTPSTILSARFVKLSLQLDF